MTPKSQAKNKNPLPIFNYFSTLKKGVMQTNIQLLVFFNILSIQ